MFRLTDFGTVYIKQYRKCTATFDFHIISISFHNPIFCHYLKQIAVLCGIERKLVFHVARHTYATEITLSHGVPLETVSKMLGHSRIGTTQLYAKVTDNKIDTDTKALDKKIAERFSVVI
jgi:integrase/recombinase XerD